MEPQQTDWKLELKGFALGMVGVLVLVGLTVTATAAGWLPKSEWTGRIMAGVAAVTCVLLSSAWVRRQKNRG